MRIPISYAMGYPERISSGLNGIDLTQIGKLTFFKPDFKKFTCLALAYNVLDSGLSESIVLNLSNELSVNAFLKKQISFDKISQTIDFMLNNIKSERITKIDDIFLFSNFVIDQTKSYLSQFQK